MALNQRVSGQPAVTHVMLYYRSFRLFAVSTNRIESERIIGISCTNNNRVFSCLFLHSFRFLSKLECVLVKCAAGLCVSRGMANCKCPELDYQTRVTTRVAQFTCALKLSQHALCLCPVYAHHSCEMYADVNLII